VNRNDFARTLVTGSALFAVLSIGIAAFARPPYVGIVKKVYPDATISCKTCHDGKPPAVNKYGKAVKGLLDKSKDKKTLTEAQIKALLAKGVKPEGVK
jgi:hypothetical protein